MPALYREQSDVIYSPLVVRTFTKCHLVNDRNCITVLLSLASSLGGMRIQKIRSTTLFIKCDLLCIKHDQHCSN